MTRRDDIDELARDAYGPLATVHVEQLGPRCWTAEVWAPKRKCSVEDATRPLAAEALADVLRGKVARRTGRAA